MTNTSSAGAEIIETNTFGATRHKLQPYGLEGKLREINIAAAAIAREAAGERVYVAGAIGPLGLADRAVRSDLFRRG